MDLKISGFYIFNDIFVSTIIFRTHKSMFMFIVFVIGGFLGLFIFEEQVLDIINL